MSSQLPSCASRSSSIRFAPAEKFGASLPTTSAREVRRGLLDAGVQHLERVAADGVHLRVELDAPARRRRDRRGSRRGSSSRRRRVLARSSAAADRAPPAAALRRGSGCARHRSRSATSGGGSVVARRVEHFADADRRPRSRTVRAPSRSPTASRGRRRRSSGRCRARRVPRRAAAGPSVARRNSPTLSLPRNSVFVRSATSSIARAASSAGSRGDCRARYVSVAGSSVRISDAARRSSRACRSPAPLFSPTEPRSISFSTSGGSANCVGLVGRQLRQQIARDVAEDVEAGDVHRAERGALRPAERRAR